MTRALYQGLLWLHPPRFRREFSGEMLWIFESSVGEEGPAGLLSDAVISLARQWLLRSGAWKIGVALAGALLQVGVGSIGMLLFTRAAAKGPQGVARISSIAISEKSFVGLTAVLAAGLIVSIVLLALWTRRFLFARMTVRPRVPRRNRVKRPR